MSVYFYQRHHTPAKPTKTSLKREPKPDRFTFASTRLKNPNIAQIQNAYFPRLTQHRAVNSSKNSSQKSIGLNKLYRVETTPERRLQFVRKNSGIKKATQNILRDCVGESIKRVPLMFVDGNARRQTSKAIRTPEMDELKSRSISHSPVVWRHSFSINSSKNYPESWKDTKNTSCAEIPSALQIPQIPIRSGTPTIRHQIFSYPSSPVVVKVSDFQKGRLLGKGYFGEVFIVRHKLSGFICALKVMSKQKIQKEKVQESLLREIKIHSFLNHENIINMYGVLEDETNVYILQELAADNLYNVLTRHKQLSEKQAAPYIRQTLKGLKQLHKHHIIHRDIKPQNILISYDGKVKICDFGWAVHSPFQMRKSNIGTLLYLSPQNIIGKGYDNRHDIWAVGIMSYELLTGSIPFNIWVEDEKTKIITDPINFPEYLEVPKRAKTFVFRMLQKQPSMRASIQALLEDSFLKEL